MQDSLDSFAADINSIQDFSPNDKAEDKTVIMDVVQAVVSVSDCLHVTVVRVQHKLDTVNYSSKFFQQHMHRMGFRRPTSYVLIFRLTKVFRIYSVSKVT